MLVTLTQNVTILIRTFICKELVFKLENWSKLFIFYDDYFEDKDSEAANISFYSSESDFEAFSTLERKPNNEPNNNLINLDIKTFVLVKFIVNSVGTSKKARADVHYIGQITERPHTKVIKLIFSDVRKEKLKFIKNGTNVLTENIV